MVFDGGRDQRWCLKYRDPKTGGMFTSYSLEPSHQPSAIIIQDPLVPWWGNVLEEICIDMNGDLTYTDRTPPSLDDVQDSGQALPSLHPCLHFEGTYTSDPMFLQMLQL